MSIRINKLDLPLVSIPSTPSTTQSPTTSKQPTVTPFSTSSYDTTQPVKLADGTSITLPTLSSDETQQVNQLFGGLSDDQISTLRKHSQNLSASIYATLAKGTQAPQTSTDDSDDDNDDSTDGISWSSGVAASVPSMQSAQPVSAISDMQSTSTALKSDSPALQAIAPAALKTSSSALSSNTNNPGPTVSVGVATATPTVAQSVAGAASAYNSATGGKAGYDQTVQAVAYMGVIGLQTDLTNYAKTMQDNLNKQQSTRTDLSTVRQAIADWPAGQTTQHFTWTTFDDYGNPTAKSGDLTKDQASVLGDNLSDQLDSQGQSNQLDQLKLQDMTENYQQGINTISNLLKFQSDTVKAIINNIHT